MEINRNNYEAYFIDYMEGTLDESLVDLFIDFIKQNPDLKEELALFESTSVTPENISFNKKSTLYKEKFDADAAFNEAAVAQLEGDFSDVEKAEFEIYLAKHPEKEKDALLYNKTKIQADTSIVFSKKNELYKKSKRKVILMWSTRVAAILILAFVLFSQLEQSNKELPTNNRLAKVENSLEKNTEIPPSKVEPSKQEVSKPERVETKTVRETPIKKAIHENKANKNIYKTDNVAVEPELIAVTREVVVPPAELQKISATLASNMPTAHMETMYLYYPEIEDDKLIGDIVKEKLNLGRITKAGLDVITSISNERFEYKTRNDGKVSGYKYDSRLLAFSIPGKKTQP